MQKARSTGSWKLGMSCAVIDHLLLLIGEERASANRRLLDTTNSSVHALHDSRSFLLRAIVSTIVDKMTPSIISRREER